MTGYGLAFPHNSKHKTRFNDMLLEYKENGDLERLSRWPGGHYLKTVMIKCWQVLASRCVQAKHAGEESQRAPLHRSVPVCIPPSRSWYQHSSFHFIPRFSHAFLVIRDHILHLFAAAGAHLCPLRAPGDHQQPRHQQAQLLRYGQVRRVLL